MNQTQDNLRSALKARLVNIIRKPEQEPKQIRPSNAGLTVAIVAANIIFAFLDLISAITVGNITHWFYGILTFIAGFAPMLIHEILFTRAYAHKLQKILAVVGALLGIASTLTIGILAAAVNIFKLTNTLPPFALEAALLVTLVVIAGIHGVLFGIYFYIDEGHRAGQKRAEQLAWHDQQREGLEDAKIIVAEAKKINREIQTIVDDGDGEALDVAYSQLRGASLLTENNNGKEPVLANNADPKSFQK